jgi:hypothetical protein
VTGVQTCALPISVELTITVLSPTFMGGHTFIVKPTPIDLFITCDTPSLHSFSDVSIDFIGTPRKGTSPLIVDFIATVDMSNATKAGYTISGYKWYFDYDNNPSIYEITTINTNSHTFIGYQGKQYSVRVCVMLELI